MPAKSASHASAVLLATVEKLTQAVLMARALEVLQEINFVLGFNQQKRRAIFIARRFLLYIYLPITIPTLYG